MFLLNWIGYVESYRKKRFTHKTAADNLVDVAELGVGIWAGFEKASLELKRTLGTANLKRIAASKEAILARAARKAARKELAKPWSYCGGSDRARTCDLLRVRQAL